MHSPRELAQEIAAAYANKQFVAPPTSREGGLDLATAYAVEAELKRMREADGHRAVGVKVGYANKAMWRALKLETVVWGHIYDDTVRHSTNNQSSVSIGAMLAPKIEPEIVFKLKSPIPDGADAATALASVEWLALGFEIIDCVYPDWKITPIDFVAGYGLHAGLLVGESRPVSPADVEELATFTVTLQRNGATIATGAGKNSLKNPALCISELSSAMAKAGTPIGAGELISSGTLTESQFMSAGDTFAAIVDGINLPPLTAVVTG